MFDSWQVSWKFFSDLFLLSTFSNTGVRPASNTNEYKGIFLGVKCVRRVELTALPSLLCRMSEEGWTPNIPSRVWIFITYYRKALPLHPLYSLHIGKMSNFLLRGWADNFCLLCLIFYYSKENWIKPAPHSHVTPPPPPPRHTEPWTHSYL
jgi:hypothetical protein